MASIQSRDLLVRPAVPSSVVDKAIPGVVHYNAKLPQREGDAVAG